MNAELRGLLSGHADRHFLEIMVKAYNAKYKTLKYNCSKGILLYKIVPGNEMYIALCYSPIWALKRGSSKKMGADRKPDSKHEEQRIQRCALLKEFGMRWHRGTPVEVLHNAQNSRLSVLTLVVSKHRWCLMLT